MEEDRRYEFGPIVIVPNPEIGYPDDKTLSGICHLIARHFVIQYPGAQYNLVLPLESVVQAGLMSKEAEPDFEHAYRTLLELSIDPKLN